MSQIAQIISTSFFERGRWSCRVSTRPAAASAGGFHSRKSPDDVGLRRARTVEEAGRPPGERAGHGDRVLPTPSPRVYWA